MALKLHNSRPCHGPGKRSVIRLKGDHIGPFNQPGRCRRLLVEDLASYQCSLNAFQLPDVDNRKFLKWRERRTRFGAQCQNQVRQAQLNGAGLGQVVGVPSREDLRSMSSALTV